MDEQLKYVALSLNTSYQSSIKEVPFFLFHGRDCDLPYSEVLKKTRLDYAVGEDMVADTKARLKKAFQNAKENSEYAHEKSAEWYNRKAKNSTIDEGDMVFLKNENLQGKNIRKLNQRWNGPYRVLEVVNDQNLKIKGIYQDQRIQVVHRDRVKKGIEMEDNFPIFQETSNSIDTGHVNDVNGEVGLNLNNLPETDQTAEVVDPVIYRENEAEINRENEPEINRENNNVNIEPRYNLRSRGPVQNYDWVQPRVLERAQRI